MVSKNDIRDKYEKKNGFKAMKSMFLKQVVELLRGLCIFHSLFVVISHIFALMFPTCLQVSHRRKRGGQKHICCTYEWYLLSAKSYFRISRPMENV